MQEQFQQLARKKQGDPLSSVVTGKGKLVVIGQDCVEALQALRNAGEEVQSCTIFLYPQDCIRNGFILGKTWGHSLLKCLKEISLNI